ncbi:MAG: hypothetical protein ACP5IL_02220 [Syntrophobacteraceae bacterium]
MGVLSRIRLFNTDLLTAQEKFVPEITNSHLTSSQAARSAAETICSPVAKPLGRPYLNHEFHIGNNSGQYGGMEQMLIDLQNISKEDMDILRRKLLMVAQTYEPWADWMYLSGAGDQASDHFPLDLFSEEIESITITGIPHEAAQVEAA